MQNIVYRKICLKDAVLVFFAEMQRKALSDKASPLARMAQSVQFQGVYNFFDCTPDILS